MDGAVIASVAACRETRAELYRKLDGLGQLELMATFESRGAGGRNVLFVFRFLDHDGHCISGTAGIYPVSGVPGLVCGTSTISRFERWEDRTAEEHAAAILDNFAEWRRVLKP